MGPAGGFLEFAFEDDFLKFLVKFGVSEQTQLRDAALKVWGPPADWDEEDRNEAIENGTLPTGGTTRSGARTKAAPLLERFQERLQELGVKGEDGDPITLFVKVGNGDSAPRYPTRALFPYSEIAMVILKERKSNRAWQVAHHQMAALKFASWGSVGRVRIGAYPAHVERFLGAALQSMHEHFSWIEVDLQVHEARAREKASSTTSTDQSAEGKEAHPSEPADEATSAANGPRAIDEGPVAKAFVRAEAAEDAVDYMLAPVEKAMEAGYTPEMWVECYTYTMRVVGAADTLKDIFDANTNTVDTTKLHGQVLAVAPEDFSSRTRIDKLLKQVGAEPARRISDAMPLKLRVYALAGKALAVLSDEYSVVGIGQGRYPALRHMGEEYTITMVLIHRQGLKGVVHDAFLETVRQLGQAEKKNPLGRYAALDRL